jgi:branched-chain amino acid transport system permease protein
MTVAAGMVRRHLILALVLVGLVALPVFATDYFTSFVVTRALMLGMAAATIVFLHAYGGMTSLAQYLLFGIAGFMVGNASGQAGSRGLQLGWDPWVAVVFALAVCLAVSWVLGALASNSTGIYYLMLTLVYAVIGFSFFGQVTTFSGFGGITGITPPALIAGQPFRLYYLALLLSLATYLGLRALARTPFGLALQGIRDDHVRMASLGYNVQLHRTVTFTIAGFIAGCAGVLNVWWNGQIDPTSISIGPTLDLLIIAVIGGISYLEGAWLGAIVFVAANNYLRSVPLIDELGITGARFNTVVGLLLLLIMILSPEGLAGIIDRIRSGGRRFRGLEPHPETVGGGADTRTAGDGAPTDGAS